MKYLVYSFHANSLQYLEYAVLWISLWTYFHSSSFNSSPNSDIHFCWMLFSSNHNVWESFQLHYWFLVRKLTKCCVSFVVCLFFVWFITFLRDKSLSVNIYSIKITLCQIILDTDISSKGSCSWRAGCRNVQRCCPWVKCSFHYHKPFSSTSNRPHNGRPRATTPAQDPPHLFSFPYFIWEQPLRQLTQSHIASSRYL